MSRTIRSLLLLGLPTLLAAGCDSDDGRPVYPSFDKTILELARERPELSRFVALIEQGGLEAPLSSTLGMYTVFAPVNEAFPEGALAASPLEANRWVRFLTAGGRQKLNLVEIQTEMRTLTSTTFEVRASDEGIDLMDGFGNVSRVVVGDLEGSNGVLHIIDRMLVPPVGVIYEELAEAGGFERFLELVANAELDEVLTGTATVTVLAPNNAAILALGDLSKAAPGILDNLAHHHIFLSKVASTALPPSVQSLAKLPIGFVETATVVVSRPEFGPRLDIVGTNGLGHELSAVLAFPTILTVATTLPDFSELARFVDYAGEPTQEALDPATLAGGNPITVFAPTNAAFAALGATLDGTTTSTTVVAQILGEHVLETQLLAEDLAESLGKPLKTKNGTVTVSRDSAGNLVLTNDAGKQARVVASDIRTRSGAVHVIDAVLQP